MANNRTAMKHMKAPMPSEWAYFALSIASMSFGWSSVIWSTHSWCTSFSHDQRSWNFAPDAKLSRGRVEVLAFVERRVGGNQIDAFAIHGSEEVEVVPVEQGSVLPVGFCHKIPLISAEKATKLP